MTTLREKMKQEMTLRGLSTGTQKQYLRAVIKLNNHYNRSPCGKALSPMSIGKIYQRSKHKACIKKQGGVHALRHAFATHTLESGADLYMIKQMLGHASVTSTVRYLRMTEKTRQMIQSPVEQLKL